MESLIETFHIDAKLLVAQTVNFAIVFAVLYFFALKPVAKVLADRSRKIEKSLSDAKEIEARLAKAEEDYSRALSQARKEAGLIIAKANEQAGEKRAELIAKAKEEIGQIINDEKAKIQAEKARTLKEVREHVAELVAQSLEKLLKEQESDDIASKIRNIR